MVAKHSTNDFINKAILIHGQKYNYEKSNYTGALKSIIITCPKHGDFSQKARDHLSGRGCIECAGNRKSNIEDFIKKSKVLHFDKYNYDKSIYINNKEKLIITCPIHGDFKQIPLDHLKGCGCSKCKAEQSSINLKSNIEDFIQKAIIIHNNFYNYSKFVYFNNKKKGVIICPLHGEFKQIPNAHLSGQGCPKCKSLKISIIKKSNIDEFIIRANKIHNYKYNYENFEYFGSESAGIIICKQHGMFKQTPHAHLSGQGCPYCYGNAKSNNEDFVKKSNIIHNNLYNYDKVNYINSKIKVIIVCSKHGEFKQTPNSHLSGRNCPKCSGTYYENLCRKIMFELFNEEFIKYRPKTLISKKKGRLELDCYNEKLKINIEYDGIQHYKYPNPFHKNKKQFKLQQQNDKLKDKWCKNNGILNIRVSYNYDTKEKMCEFILNKLKFGGRL